MKKLKYLKLFSFLIYPLLITTGFHLSDPFTAKLVKSDTKSSQTIQKVKCYEAIDPVTDKKLSVCGNQPWPVDPISYPDEPLINHKDNSNDQSHVCHNGDISSRLAFYGISASNYTAYSAFCGVLESNFTVKQNGAKLFTTTIVQAVLQATGDPRLYAYVYRITLSPTKSEENPNHFATIQNAHTIVDLNYFPRVVSDANLKIGIYAPLNVPSETTTSVGVGISSSGPSLSASVSFANRELEVKVKSKASSKIFDVSYKISNNSISDYNSSENFFYGMFTLEKTDSQAFNYFKVEHHVEYIARDISEGPTAIASDYPYVLKLK